LNSLSIIDSQYLPAVVGGPALGDYKPSARTADHSGWLLCDGRNLSRTTYSALFNIIGTSFGGGDGSTTFTLPSPAGRALGIIGAGSGLTNRLLGTSLGAENHTLLISEMPSHTHDIQGYFNLSAGSDRQCLSKNIETAVPAEANRAASRGGSQPHNNMQPTIFIGNLFIYAGV
jgi:microcystin-dependent protein